MVVIALLGRILTYSNIIYVLQFCNLMYFEATQYDYLHINNTICQFCKFKYIMEGS